MELPTQALPAHAAVPFVGAAQARPHRPQLLTSLVRLSHVPPPLVLAPQLDSPPGHEPTHELPTQAGLPPDGAVQT